MRQFLRFAGGLLALMPAALMAGGLTVSPVLVKLEPGQRSTAITLSNGGDQPQRIQVEAYRWTRAGGQETLQPDSGLLLNPPLFELAPGGSQIVRLGLRSGAVPPAQQETAYRIFFQEVPRADHGDATALRMVLRIGVPLFLLPSKPAPSLHWSVVRSPEGAQLQLENRGNVHTRIANLRLTLPPAGTGQNFEGFVYVFPGEIQRWPLDGATAAHAGPLLLDALADGGSLHVELPAAER